jgi:hypothetical protein
MALDECYDLSDEERSFFGIQDDDELKAHIIQVLAEAHKVCNREPRQNQHGNSCLVVVYPYPCIRLILQSES